jgi:DNA-binding NarL/FixJ family response regulator
MLLSRYLSWAGIGWRHASSWNAIHEDRSMKTMLFVDDHPIYRDGLQRAVAGAVPGLRILVADGASSALELLSVTDDIDFCLSDYRLAGGDGATLLEEVRRRYPDIAIGLLCAEPTASVIEKVRATGGVACLSKDRDTDSLAAAIDTIFNGGTVFDDSPLPTSYSNTLSIRRREILLLAGNGQLDKQIGEQLCITESTVRNHWQHIFTRLQASNRTEAVAKAMRLGII